MIPPFGSKGADSSAKRSAGSETPLLRPVKLQQPHRQNASDYDVSCVSLTQVWLVELGPSLWRKIHCLVAEHGKG